MSGWDFPEDGRGLAQVDWDGDGDLDVWVTNRNGPQLRFLRNDVTGDTASLQLQLEGTTCNRDAVGARVEVQLTGQAGPLVRGIRAGEGFLSQSSKEVHVGLGASRSIEQVTVHWPGGIGEVFAGIETAGRYRLVQGRGVAEPQPPRPGSPHLLPAELAEPVATDRVRVVSASRLPLPGLNYRRFESSGVAESADASSQVARPSASSLLLVHLWSSRCPTCLEELRTWSQQAGQLRAAKLEVLALSVDGLGDSEPAAIAAQRAAARATLERLKIPFSSGMATAETVETLRLVLQHLFDLHTPLTVPLSITLDSAGNLQAIYRGPVSVDQLQQDALLTAGNYDGLRAQSLPFQGKWYQPPMGISPFELVWKLVEESSFEDAVEYFEQNRERLSRHHQFFKLVVLVGNAYLARGEAQQAMELYRESLRSHDDYPDALNNLAWLLATHPDAEIRNGPEAIRCAEQAVRFQGESPSLLDTLAAAYAADGRFENAISTAVTAAKLADQRNQPTLRQKIAQRLELYRTQQPFLSH